MNACMHVRTISWGRQRNSSGTSELPLEHIRLPGHYPALPGTGRSERQLWNTGPNHGSAMGAEEHQKLQ